MGKERAMMLEKLDSFTYMEGREGFTGLLDHYDVSILAAKEKETDRGLKAKASLVFWDEYPGERMQIIVHVKDTLALTYPDIMCTMDGDIMTIEAKGRKA